MRATWTRARLLITIASLFATALVGVVPAGAALPPTLDSDGDGWIDVVEDQLGSNKADMFSTPESFAIPVSCLDKADNDLDTAVDDADPGCHPPPVASGAFPAAGFDVFESEMSLDGLELTTPLGPCKLDFDGTGPTVIQRGAPVDLGGGQREIDVEIVAMQLTGSGNLLPGTPCNPSQRVMSVPVGIVEDPAKASRGKVTADAAGADFPADSFFDIFFLVDTPLGLIPGSLRVDNDRVTTLPPFHTPNDTTRNPDCYEFGGAHEHCPKPPLDHFLCYTADFTEFQPDPVRLLLDQFVGSPTRVFEPNHLCNPVAKNQLPIFDRNAHLVLYDLQPHIATGATSAPVVVRNQFGTQTFNVGNRDLLAVPTRKNQQGPPLALDHYACHGITGNQLNVPVALQDQFGNANTVVTRPLLLCNPAAKVHNGQLTVVQDRRWHLVCYGLQSTPFNPVTATTANQFGQATAVARERGMLCVPSQKFFERFPHRPPHTFALVDPSQGRWYLRDLAGNEKVFFYGNPDDIPFMGDWDCDGDDTPGLFRQSDAFAYLRNSNTQGIADIRFFFGNPDDIPLAGDFDGDGCDTLSIYRPSEGRFYIINKLGQNEGGLGAADFSFLFGNLGDKPVVGDWDGDGIDEVGLHRESTGLFYWRDSLTQGIGDGNIIFGDPGDRFVAGDWGVVDGRDTPAIFRPGDGRIYLRDTLTQGIADENFAFGESPWLPVSGAFEDITRSLGLG